MVHAKYIGRVGGLAIALGVGFAIANAEAVASADDGGSSAASSAHSAASPGAGSTAVKGRASSASSTDTETGSAASSAGSDSQDSDADAESASSDEDDAAAGDDRDLSADESASARPDDSDVEQDSDDAVVEPGSVNPDGDTRGAESLPQDHQESGVSENAEPTPEPDAQAVPSTTPSGGPVAAAPDITPVVSSVPRRVTAPNPLSVNVAPLAVPAKAPADDPIALTLMTIWRRLSGMAYNRNPEANPIEIGENAAGNVLGTVGATDPDGDRLRYILTQGPKYGELTLNNDGTFSYTPGFVLSRDGGTDTFTVEVRDVGWRLFSRPGSVSVPVTVTVGAGEALGLGGTPFAVVSSTDGRTLYVSDVENNRVSVVDVSTGSVTRSISVGKSPYGMAMAADGRLYVVNSDDGTVSVIDTRTNAVTGTPIRVGNSPTSAAVNASGTTVYVTNGNDDTVSVIDTATLSVTRIKVGDGPFGVALSGTKLYVTNEFDGTVSVIDTATGAVVKTLTAGVAPTTIAIRGDRAVVTNSGSWSVGDDGTVTLIDTTTDTVITTIAVGEMPAGVAINADATLAYVTDAGSNTVTVVDLRSGQVVGDPVDIVSGAAGVAIAADGRLYIAGSQDGVIAPVAFADPVAGVFTPPTLPATPAAVSGSVAGAVSGVAASAGRPSTNSKGFDVYNLTTGTLTLSEFRGSGRPENGSPAEGYTIPPGGVLHFDVGVNYWSPVKQVIPVFTNADKEEWAVKMSAEWVIVAFVPIRVAGTMQITYRGTKNGTGDPDPKNWFADLTTEAYIYDAPESKVELSGAAVKASTDLLNTVCESGRATCVFTPKKDAAITADWTAYKAPSTRGGASTINNSGPREQSGQVKVVETEAAKVSVEGSFKLSFGGKDKLGLELAGKLGREWTNTKTFEETTTIIAPPFTRVELLVRTPVLRVTGDLVIRIGNTVVTMKDIVVEVPDVNRDMEKFYRYSPSSGPAVTV